MKSIFIKTAIIIYCFLSFIASSFSQEISGYKWEEVTNIPSEFSESYWLDVYFLPLNPNYGWICGFGGQVIRTSDNGNTWKGVIISGVNQLESIQFPSINIGYLSGQDGIFKTTDGGVNWSNITPSSSTASLWGCYFLDNNNGFVIGGGCIEKQEFWRTTDGGSSWSVFIADLPNSGLTDLIVYSMSGLGYASSSGYIWETKNGGVTWDTLCSTGENDWQEDLTIKGNTILVPFTIGCSGGQGPGGLRSSNDFGLTWKEYQMKGRMFGTFLIDSLTGWGVGDESSVYYTNDGGGTWFLANNGIDSNKNIDDIWFINENNGWLVGEDIYKFTGNIVVDVNETTLINGLIQRISPNPVENEILISINNNTTNEINIKLYNLTGNVVLEKRVLPMLQKEITFDLSNINSGLYFLQVQQGINSEIQKIVKY